MCDLLKFPCPSFWEKLSPRKPMMSKKTKVKVNVLSLSDKAKFLAGHQWLTPVILATQETEIRRITVQSQASKWFVRPYLKKIHHKKGLGEWLKV
jgi:hypothetical protein